MKSALTRRHFLFAAGAGGVATAAALATKKNPEVEPKQAGTANGGKGYHVTEHIRKYYNTAKV